MVDKSKDNTYSNLPPNPDQIPGWPTVEVANPTEFPHAYSVKDWLASLDEITFGVLFGEVKELKEAEGDKPAEHGTGYLSRTLIDPSDEDIYMQPTQAIREVWNTYFMDTAFNQPIDLAFLTALFKTEPVVWPFGFIIPGEAINPNLAGQVFQGKGTVAAENVTGQYVQETVGNKWGPPGTIVTAGELGLGERYTGQQYQVQSDGTLDLMEPPTGMEQAGVGFGDWLKPPDEMVTQGKETNQEPVFDNRNGVWTLQDIPEKPPVPWNEKVEELLNQAADEKDPVKATELLADAQRKWNFWNQMTPGEKMEMAIRHTTDPGDYTTYWLLMRDPNTARAPHEPGQRRIPFPDDMIDDMARRLGLSTSGLEELNKQAITKGIKAEDLGSELRKADATPEPLPKLESEDKDAISSLENIGNEHLQAGDFKETGPPTDEEMARAKRTQDALDATMEKRYRDILDQHQFGGGAYNVPTRTLPGLETENVPYTGAEHLLGQGQPTPREVDPRAQEFSRAAAQAQANTQALIERDRLLKGMPGYTGTAYANLLPNLPGYTSSKAVETAPLPTLNQVVDPTFAKLATQRQAQIDAQNKAQRYLAETPQATVPTPLPAPLPAPLPTPNQVDPTFAQAASQAQALINARGVDPTSEAQRYLAETPQATIPTSLPTLPQVDPTFAQKAVDQAAIDAQKEEANRRILAGTNTDVTSYAGGGIAGLRGPELAVVGEYGPEMITPLRPGQPVGYQYLGDVDTPFKEYDPGMQGSANLTVTEPTSPTLPTIGNVQSQMRGREYALARGPEVDTGIMKSPSWGYLTGIRQPITLPHLGAPRYPSAQAWRRMRPTERAGFQQEVRRSGITWEDYEHELQKVLPGFGRRGSLPTMRPSVVRTG